MTDECYITHLLITAVDSTPDAGHDLVSIIPCRAGAVHARDTGPLPQLKTCLSSICHYIQGSKALKAFYTAVNFTPQLEQQEACCEFQRAPQTLAVGLMA